MIESWLPGANAAAASAEDPTFKFEIALLYWARSSTQCGMSYNTKYCLKFKDLYTDLIKEAPEDPFQFIYEWGATKKGVSVKGDERNSKN